MELYRKSRLDLAEGGANTLFLAIGFLLWKKAGVDGPQYRAPLILQPVKLGRRSVRSGVRLTINEDEPRFNLTLLQMLRQDFELDIPNLPVRCRRTSPGSTSSASGTSCVARCAMLPCSRWCWAPFPSPST